MNKSILLLYISLLLFSCTSNENNDSLVPMQIQDFSKDFIIKLQEGDIEYCLKTISPEVIDKLDQKYLKEIHLNLQSIQLDSLSIVAISKKESPVTDETLHYSIYYSIDYECVYRNERLYFSTIIHSTSKKLRISGFDTLMSGEMLPDKNSFTFKEKGYKHLLFLLFSLFVFGLIVFTVFIAIKSKVEKKWLWIIGILIGFIEFSINWTTGEVSLFQSGIHFLGVSLIKQSCIGPWILEFSLPIVAIIFLLKYRCENNQGRGDR